MSPASRVEFRAEMLSKVPRWYMPVVHLAFPALAGLSIAVFAATRIEDLRPWQLAFVPVFLFVANGIEWHAHRGILHRRVRFLEPMFVRHTPQHHGLYVAGAMAITSLREVKFILLPSYGVLTILALTSPVSMVLLWAGQPNLAALWIVCAVAYLLSYEWLHLAYHLPEGSFIGRLAIIRRLRRHHELHHAPQLMQRWNFNVTLPVWDHLKGTTYSTPAPGEAPSPALARRVH